MNYLNETETKPILSETQRDAKGRFAPGNTLSRGHTNHRAKRQQEYKEAILRAVSPNDLRAIVRKLVEMAKAGNLAAIKEVLDRCLGRVSQAEQTPNDVEIVVDLPPDLIPES